MNIPEKSTMEMESSSKVTDGKLKRRSASVCSNDSERNRKRRNLCSKDKRKKSKRRSNSNSSSSSSVSSLETHAYKAKKSRSEDIEHKTKRYENGHTTEPQRRTGRYNNNYGPYKRFSDDYRNRGYLNSRPRYHSYDRNKRDMYNNPYYNRHTSDRRPYYRNYKRTHGYSKFRTQDHYKGTSRDASNQSIRENSLTKYTKSRAIPEMEQPDIAKDNTVSEQVKKRTKSRQEKTQLSQKKLKRKRSSSASSVSSVSSTSSDSSSSSTSSSSSSSSTSDTESSDSSTDSSADEKKRKKATKKSKKLKKALKKRKKKKRMKKKLKKKLKKSAVKKKSRDKKKSKERASKEKTIVSDMTEKAKAMVPMTKEEWEKKQGIVRKVYDEETGRYRLIKGDGEILEQIVSRERHKEINRQATKGDGDYFQTRLKMNAL